MNPLTASKKKNPYNHSQYETVVAKDSWRGSAPRLTQVAQYDWSLVSACSISTDARGSRTAVYLSFYSWEVAKGGNKPDLSVPGHYALGPADRACSDLASSVYLRLFHSQRVLRLFLRTAGKK